MSAFPPPPPPPPVPPPPLGHSVAPERQARPAALVQILRAMLRSRLIETRIIELYRQNRVTGGCYTGIGNEATSVGMAWPMAEADVLVPTHRDMGSHLVRGHSLRDVMLQYLKRRSSMTGGRDSGLHMGREGSNIVGMISHLAHMLPVAVGVALAERQKGSNAAVLTSVGDGASSLGDFHEALNFAAVQKLPVIFVIVNNQYAYSTPVTIQYAVDQLSKRAAGYGMAGETVDGTDAIAVLDSAERAFARARKGEGPSLIESVTMRMRGHSEHDDFRYVPRTLMEAWKAWDPVTRLEQHLIAAKALTVPALEAIRAEVSAEIDRAVEEAEEAPLPEGPEAVEGVFREWAEGWTVPDGAARLMAEDEAGDAANVVAIREAGGRR
ncbi:MAG: thiamine pyrophosphate-dependent dehydrogenase E1 component subunit alpha [Deltaproteobacteria bacterium]|nr:thiamine pyrophosphate-dependent dehydrogenase E1 component subunit alpha [Deltaproteobacteria bacterium]